MPLTLEMCEHKASWDRFVDSSPQRNIFCYTRFLDAMQADYDLLWLEEAGRPQLGAIVLSRDGKPLPAPFPFTQYQGVLFSDAVQRMPAHRRVRYALTALETFLGLLKQRQDLMSFSLHHSLEDLRAFQWFHYHEPELGMFRIDLRYTGLLDLKVLEDFPACLAAVRATRRQEMRKAEAAGLTADECDDVDALDCLHRLTFERQAQVRDDDHGRLLRSLAQAALAQRFGWLLVCRDRSGRALSASLFLHDGRTGYYLFAGNDPSQRATGSGTFLMLENLRRCQALGLASVDFLGINSPDRGDFKTSFNAVPVPYFDVTWERPR